MEQSTHAAVNADIAPGRRTLDPVEALLRRGAITPEMARAAEDFRVRFATSQLDPFRALEWSRMRSRTPGRQPGADETDPNIESARRETWRALQAVGGISSPAGSCLWHVIGWQQSLREWAREQGWNGHRINADQASGVLIAALGTLAQHYERGGRP